MAWYNHSRFRHEPTGSQTPDRENKITLSASMTVYPSRGMSDPSRVRSSHGVRHMNTEAREEAGPVVFEQDGEKITITITGRVYANMKRVADALNGVSWTDSDNTPASVCEFWIGSLLWRVGFMPEENETNNVTELTSDIQDGIDTGADFGSKTDEVRRRELKAAFDAIDWGVS